MNNKLPKVEAQLLSEAWKNIYIFLFRDKNSKTKNSIDVSLYDKYKINIFWKFYQQHYHNILLVDLIDILLQVPT